MERIGPWLVDVTRYYEIWIWSMLRDITRLGNDNHSQIARIKKPDGSRAWDLNTTVYVLSCSSEVSRTSLHYVDERWTKDVDNIAFGYDLTTFVTSFCKCFHFGFS